MPKRSTLKLTKRIVEKLKAEDKDGIYWDGELAGFGVRVHATGRKLFIVQSRGPAGLKRVTLGPVGAETIEKYRSEAAVAIDRIKQGENPRPPKPAPEPTVADLAARCVSARFGVRCKPATAKHYKMDSRPSRSSCVGDDAAFGGRAERSRRAASPDARHACDGEPGGLGTVEAVRSGRDLGDGAARP